MLLSTKAMVRMALARRGLKPFSTGILHAPTGSSLKNTRLIPLIL